MKILGILFVVFVAQLFVTTCGASKLPRLGSCTFKQYTIKMRSCTTEFFVSMTSDPHDPCGPKFAALKNCVVEKLKTCVPSLSEDETVQHVVEQNFKEKTYCDNAGIEKITFYPKVSEVPCAQEYFNKVPDCYNKTIQMWRTNRADKRLCWEYAKAKWCDRYLISVSCIVYRVYNEAKELVDLHYDDYNPFCVRAPTPTTNATLKSTTSAARSMFYHGSFVNVLVSFWPIVIFGSLVTIC